MRISSAMVYDTGLRSINDKSTSYLHNMQMLATGRRIVTPSDDPVAAARALVVTEAKDINAQFATNQSNAQGALSLEESQMTSLSDVLTRVRELAVEGGDAALSPSNLRSITTELRGRFEELLGIANTTDGNGDFIFSGNMGTTKPFSANVDALLAAAGNEVTYSGDSGQRSLQVSPTRFLQISDSGADVFRQIANGNGHFVTNYAATNSGTGVIDAGSVTNQATWDSQPNKKFSINFWVDTNGIAGKTGETYYDLVDSTTGKSLLTGNAPVIPGSTTTVPLVPSLATAGLRVYRDNAGIPLSKQPGDPAAAFAAVGGSLGGIVNVTGDPATGDTFTIGPSSSQSVFRTIANLIGTLESMQSTTLNGAAYTSPTVAVDTGGSFNLTVNGVTKSVTVPSVAPGSYTSITLANALNTAINTAFGANVATASGANGNIVLTAPTTGSNTSGISVAGGISASIFGAATTSNVNRTSTALANDIGQALTNLDQATDNILRVRAGIGARLNELESLSSVNQDVNLRYKETLSNLQDVDYAKSISDLQQNQTSLDAAQKSYMKVTQMGLFNYL